MRYLKKTSDYGIMYRFGELDSTGIVGYADAGYKSDPKSGKSQGGYVFLMNKSPLSWRSKKQSLVSTSTAQAELIALYEASRESVFLSGLKKFIKDNTGCSDGTTLIPVHEDNEACIAQVKRGFVRTDATKHIDPKLYAWVAQEDGKTLEVRPIPSKENVADIMTKALDTVLHARHTRGLGLISLSAARVEKEDSC
jgi:hypothetical protein